MRNKYTTQKHNIQNIYDSCIHNVRLNCTFFIAALIYTHFKPSIDEHQLSQEIDNLARTILHRLHNWMLTLVIESGRN